MSISLLAFGFSATPPPYVPTLTTDALSPEQFATIFQPIIANILGYPVVPSPWTLSPNAAAWSAVRVGWQQQGQPAWTVNEDVCILTAKMTNDPMSHWRDQEYAQNNDDSLTTRMTRTQVWNLHFTLYGPNSARNGEIICSSMFLDYAHDALAAQNIYAVTEWNRPMNNPELFQAQWFLRTDLDLKFNFGVTESVTVSSAVGVDVNVIPNVGPSFSFKIQK